MPELDLRSVGGKPVFRGETSQTIDYWDFGWLNPERRTDFEDQAHRHNRAAMPTFSVTGRRTTAGEKVCLWDFWNHPKVVEARGGKVFPGHRQETGSCVGVGGGNAVYSLAAMEVARLGDRELALDMFWLIPYGRSRYYSGIRGRGDGSTGSGFAKAITTDGIVPAKGEGLPPYTDTNGLFWGSQVEYAWSDGANISGDWLAKSRKHPVKTAAPINSADEMREAIRNGYPGTIASMWGGKMQCPTAGDPPVLLNSRSGSWAHQMSVHGWWDHPTLGEIFFVMNTWGLGAHGTCPSGAPRGGFWIRKADMEWIARNGECYTFSQFEGFPGQNPREWLDWALI